MISSINDLEPPDGIEKIDDKLTRAPPRKHEIAYNGVLTVIYFHLAAFYGIYLLMTSAKSATIIFNLLIYILAIIGVTAGAHRLWAHKTYKAKPPLQVVLMLMQSMSFQFSVITWVKNHRIHHKYSDTDADPHNASRGFFFSHIGWLMVKAHDEYKKRLNVIDLSDLTSNPILAFQKKYAYPIIGTMCFVMPTIVPMIFWGETFNTAWHIAVLRFILSLHAAFLSNSATHKYGNKPYNTQMLPTQNLWVSFLTCGEGFHNYHHSFPWDYRTAEVGNNFLNLTTHFIDLCAHFGWAYDLKAANEELIKDKAKKTGDGTDSWGRAKAAE